MWNAQILMLVSASVLGAVLVLGRVTWWMMTAGMYKPGKQAELALKRGESLDPIDTSIDLSKPGLVSITPDINLYVQAIGDVRHQIIVFLHGGPGCPANRPWKVAEQFAKSNYCCVFYDMRGCGRSTRQQQPMCNDDENPFASGALPKAEAAWGLGAQVLDLERLRRVLKRDKLILYGHSFGGLIATLYAMEFRENVSALILEAPANLLKMPAATGEKGDLFAQIRSMLPREKLKGFESWFKKLTDFSWQLKASECDLSHFHMQVASFYFHGKEEEMRALQQGWTDSTLLPAKADGTRYGVQGGYHTTGCYLSLGAHHDWTGAARTLSVPALVLHGEGDVSPAINSAEFASYVGAELHTITGATHFAHDEEPDAIAAVTLPFLHRNGLKGGFCSA